MNSEILRDMSLFAVGLNTSCLGNYNETFAAVEGNTNFRFFVAFANQFNHLVYHIDVEIVIVNSELRRDHVIKVPEGIKCEKINFVI